MKDIFTAAAYILSFLLFSPTTLACSPPNRDDTFVKRLVISKNVFVFRLVNSRLVANQSPDGQLSEHVEGDIQFIKSLRGKSVHRKVRFSTGWCGGLRLDVGHFYIAATDQNGSTLDLDIYDPSVLNIGAYYHRPTELLRNSPQVAAATLAIQGKPFPAEVLTGNTYFTQSYPPPAPPPPEE